MSIFGQAKMYWRLATGLRGFLEEPISLEQARSIIKERLAHREKNLLTIVKRAIFENEHSPYLRLLKIAGCEYGDFEKMVQADGIEPTMKKLCEDGIYIGLEEFKGRKEVVRGRDIFKFNESDFDNPFLLQHIESTTGGSRSTGTRTYYDFEHIAFGQAAYMINLLHAYDALNVPIILWRPILPGNGPRKVLECTKIGRIPVKWFSPVDSNNIKPSVKNRVGTEYIVRVSRFLGTQLPMPEYVHLDDAWRIAECIARLINSHGGCFVNTGASNAVRICKAAKEKGLNIAGVKFLIGGEPITRVKLEVIESVAGTACPRYVFVEAGYAGFGCFHPSAPDDVHLFGDSLAAIQHRRLLQLSGIFVEAFHFTSLSLSAPKILFNVELGDYGVLERRSCGCYWEELGFFDHIYNIRSYDKLTSQGMTFFGSDLIEIIEDILPSRFGGTSIDFQMVEEDDEKGHTHMTINVSPELGIIDEAELVKTILSELSRGKDNQRMMAEVWSQSNTLRVRRVRPSSTSTGKLLPLHIHKTK